MRKRTVLLSITAACSVGAATFGWVTIRRGFSARDNPSAVETYVAKTVRRLSIPASERNATNPFAPTPEVLSEARAHFADHCAICHGNDGGGKTQIGHNLYRRRLTCVCPTRRGSRTERSTTSSTMAFGLPECLRGARRRKTTIAGSSSCSYGICPSSRQRRNARWKRSIRKGQPRKRRSKRKSAS